MALYSHRFRRHEPVTLMKREQRRQAYAGQKKRGQKRAGEKERSEERVGNTEDIGNTVELAYGQKLNPGQKPGQNPGQSDTQRSLATYEESEAAFKSFEEREDLRLASISEETTVCALDVTLWYEPLDQRNYMMTYAVQPRAAASRELGLEVMRQARGIRTEGEKGNYENDSPQC